MKLSIADLRAVLKDRTQSMVGRKASEDPDTILAGVKDLRVVLDEMEAYANEVNETKEALSTNQSKDL
jgi:hypothetical protein